MIKDFYLLQTGLIPPLRFKRDEITRRSYLVELSTHQDVESVHKGGVNSLDIDKCSNRYLLSGCSDGSIYIHDLYNFSGVPHYTAACVSKINKNNEHAHNCSVECISWFGEDTNQLFITSSTDHNVKAWDANYMQPLEIFNCKGRIYHHECTSVPSKHPLLAVASSVKHVQLIDFRTGSSIHELRGHNSSVLACSWSPTNEYLLATGGIDNRILFWDVRSSGYLKSLDQYNGKNTSGTAHSGHVNGLKFTSDGLLLLSFGTDNRMRLWETLNGRHQMINYGKIKNDSKRHVQFAITGNAKPPLAYVPSEGYVLVLEIYTGRTIRVLRGHFNIVNCSYYREPNQELYTGGKDRNVLIWTPDTSQLEAYTEGTTYEERNISHLPFLQRLDNWSSDED